MYSGLPFQLCQADFCHAPPCTYYKFFKNPFSGLENIQLLIVVFCFVFKRFGSSSCQNEAEILYLIRWKCTLNSNTPLGLITYIGISSKSMWENQIKRKHHHSEKFVAKTKCHKCWRSVRKPKSMFSLRRNVCHQYTWIWEFHMNLMS